MKKIMFSVGYDFKDECPYVLQRLELSSLMSVHQRIQFLEEAVKEIEKAIHSSKVLAELLAHKPA